MRLICPNCGAQYEVGEDVIPEGGRDVQCSNCGHTWFEQPGASEAAENAPEVIVPPVPQPDARPEPEPEPEPEPQAQPDPKPEARTSPDTKPAPRQRALDPDVADILRGEAAFEQAARHASPQPIETQPDLDLSKDPDDDRRSREARDRLARLRGEPEVAPTRAAAAVSATMAQQADAPRRDLLPDIEEINSTLRHDRATPAQLHEAEDQPDRRNGFQRGFVIAVVIALLALAVYVFAGQISAALPQAEPALTSYVDWVNTLRLWLDSEVRGFIEGTADVPATTPAG